MPVNSFGKKVAVCGQPTTHCIVTSLLACVPAGDFVEAPVPWRPLLALVGFHNPQRPRFRWPERQNTEPTQHVDDNALDPGLRPYLLDVASE
jgi:hypothetical protein